MLLPLGLSDSAMDQCLVNLDSDVEAQVQGGGGEIKPVKNDAASAAGQEMQHSVPDSENASSFGSTSLMQSMANLPPIRVRVDDGRSGRIEEQLAQISFACGSGNMYKQVDGFGAAAALRWRGKAMKGEEEGKKRGKRKGNPFSLEKYVN